MQQGIKNHLTISRIKPYSEVIRAAHVNKANMKENEFTLLHWETNFFAANVGEIKGRRKYSGGRIFTNGHGVAILLATIIHVKAPQ